jgi:rare lipoprotein A
MRLFIKYFQAIVITSILSVFLAGCNTTYKKVNKAPVQKKITKKSNSPFRYKGSFKVGKPYKIKHTRYYPKHYTKYSSTGIASWYGAIDGFHGKPTANGDIFDKNMLTAAHKTLHIPSMIEVTNLENGKKALLMVNDRGPFSAKRILDVSEQAAEVLGFRMKGTAKVKIIYLEEETKKLLNKLQLQRVEGSVAAQDILHPTCSVDCYLKTVNMRHNILPHSTMLLASNKKDSYLSPLDSQSITTLEQSKKVATKLSVVKDIYMENNGSIFDAEDPVKPKKPIKVAPVGLKHNNYYVVVGKFKSFAQTKTMLPRLKKYGPTRISKVNKVYHIKIGPIKDLSQAKKMAASVSSNKIGINVQIVKNNQKV